MYWCVCILAMCFKVAYHRGRKSSLSYDKQGTEGKKWMKTASWTFLDMNLFVCTGVCILIIFVLMLNVIEEDDKLLTKGNGHLIFWGSIVSRASWEFLGAKNVFSRNESFPLHAGRIYYFGFIYFKQSFNVVLWY